MSIMEFTVFLTTECNFKCKYCCESCYPEKHKWMSRDMLVAVLAHIFMTQNKGVYRLLKILCWVIWCLL